MTTNPIIADVSRQSRDRLAAKANERIDQLAELLSGNPAAPSLLGSLSGIVELLRDINSYDVSIDLRGMANLFDLHALELAGDDDYEGAKLVIECAEAFARRQQQIEADHFSAPQVDRGAIR